MSNLKTCSWVIDDSTNFSWLAFQEGRRMGDTLRANSHCTVDRIVRRTCSVSKPKRLKWNWVVENRGQISYFLLRVKIRGEMDEIFQVSSSACVPTSDMFLARRERGSARAERINTFPRTYGSRTDGQIMDIRTNILIANDTFIYTVRQKKLWRSYRHWVDGPVFGRRHSNLTQHCSVIQSSKWGH